jgi:transcriptional regulator with XRE-family HTH domain
MDDARIDLKQIGERVREAREAAGFATLDSLADELFAQGCERPSIAKLSRIETGIQPVPTDILIALSDVTGIPARKLRPDLAALLIARPRGRQRAGAAR